MLPSRSISLYRGLRQAILATKVKVPAKQLVRNGHDVSYRTGAPPASRETMILAKAIGGLMWWWILWNLWHDHKHITGEFEYPDTSLWTNAELGIPPDFEE